MSFWLFLIKGSMESELWNDALGGKRCIWIWNIEISMCGEDVWVRWYVGWAIWLSFFLKIEICTFLFPKNQKKYWVEIMLRSIFVQNLNEKIVVFWPGQKIWKLCQICLFCPGRNIMNFSFSFCTTIDLNIIYTQNFCFEFMKTQKCRYNFSCKTRAIWLGLHLGFLEFSEDVFLILLGVSRLVFKPHLHCVDALTIPGPKHILDRISMTSRRTKENFLTSRGTEQETSRPCW